MFGRILNYGRPVADSPLNRGLSAWWLPLPQWSGGTRLFDLVGRYPGTLANGPVWASGLNGFTSISFDGTDDLVTVGNLGTFSDLTLEWSQAGTNNGRWPIGIEGGALGVQTGTAPNALRVRSHGVDTSSSDTISVNLTDGTWHHCVVSIRANGVASGSTVWVDGKQEYTFTATNATQTFGSVAATIGARNDPTEWFAGRIGYFRVYARAVGSQSVSLYDQWRRGFPDTLSRLSNRVWSFANSPAGGFSATSTFTTDAATSSAAAVVAEKATASITTADATTTATAVVAEKATSSFTTADATTTATAAVAVRLTSTLTTDAIGLTATAVVTSAGAVVIFSTAPATTVAVATVAIRAIVVVATDGAMIVAVATGPAVEPTQIVDFALSICRQVDLANRVRKTANATVRICRSKDF